MANNYDFMFKFIIIGDSSNPSSTQASARAASCSGSPRGDSKRTMSLRWGSSLAPGTSISKILASRFRFGIP